MALLGTFESEATATTVADSLTTIDIRGRDDDDVLLGGKAKVVAFQARNHSAQAFDDFVVQCKLHEDGQWVDYQDADELDAAVDATTLHVHLWKSGTIKTLASGYAYQIIGVQGLWSIRFRASVGANTTTASLCGMIQD